MSWLPVIFEGIQTAPMLAWLGYLLNVAGMQDRLFKSKADILEQRRLNDISAKDAELREKDVELREKDVVISGLSAHADNLALLGGPDMRARVEELMSANQQSKEREAQLQHALDQRSGDLKQRASKWQQDRKVLMQLLDARGHMARDALDTAGRAIALVEKLQRPRPQLSTNDLFPKLPAADESAGHDVVQAAIRAALSPDEGE